ncbi:MAG: HupE/UreJ family protein [Limnobacter sp.]|nr:HupE/UreJ family protein [Limnobacter sp.]
MRLWLAWIFLTLTSTGYAHTQSVSYSTWQLDTQTRATFRISLLELNRFGLHPSHHEFHKQLTHTVGSWFVAPNGCTQTSTQSLPAEPGWAKVQARFDCPNMPDTIGLKTLFDTVPYHTNLAAVQIAEATVRQVQLNSNSPVWSIQPKQDSNGFVSMFAFGVEHIVTGWDHLLFLLVLLLSTQAPARLVLLLTGFTLGHSLTLAAQVLGWVSPPSATVEWVIALSILLVAMQNTWRLNKQRGLWPYPLALACMAVGWLSGTLSLTVAVGLAVFAVCHLRSRHSTMAWFVTFTLGLFHGFGFAGLLEPLELPQETLLIMLLAFNLGVEAGQVAIVLVCILILAALRKINLQPEPWLNGLAAGAATFWLLTRTF